MKVNYDIDLTENEYVHFEGNTLEELKDVLYPDRFKDCCGYIIGKECGLCIASVKEYGVFIGYSDSENEKLSLSDRDKLDRVVDVWGDGLYVSEGLFISPETAWQCIHEFVTTGSISCNIEWISPDDIPENGNFII
ncbi:MAG: hypothetical protein K2K02_02420 [Ruminococcus sp.]|nr:hypothetical protein [Ruminococcus sp.]